jgi:hypothetical protein
VHLTDALALVCASATLPLLHEVQCAIKALQKRELYFPDLVKVLKRCKTNISAHYLGNDAFTSRAAFRPYHTLRAITLPSTSKTHQASPFALRESVDADGEKALHYLVRQPGCEDTAILLVATPLPTRGRGRRATLKRPVLEADLPDFFKHVEGLPSHGKGRGG